MYITHGILLLCTIHSVPIHSQAYERESQDSYLIVEEVSTDSPGPVFPSLITYVDYNASCNPWTVLKTVCKTYERTVACNGSKLFKSGKCECNLGEDAEFHEQWGLCVSKVGALCFLNENALGRKVCVENADCFADQEGPGHNVGQCECLYGFMEDDTGHCIVDPNVPEEDRSTERPTTRFPTRAPSITGETSESTDTISYPTTTDTSGASSFRVVFIWSWSCVGIFVLFSYF